MQVRACRANGRAQLLVEHPWFDADSNPIGRHPLLAKLSRVEAWQVELKSGMIASFAALGRREGLTTARISQ